MLVELDSLFAWLLTYALHSTVLIAVAWLAAVGLARCACRSAALRDLLPSLREKLWKVALVGGVITATLTSSLHLGPFELRFADAAQPETSVAVERPAEASTTLAVAPGLMPLGFQPPAAAPAEAPPMARRAISPPRETPWVGIVLALWAAGVAFGLARWMCRWNRLLREIDDRTPIRAGPLFEAFQRLEARSGSRRRVTLSSAPGIAAPMTLGILRAEICVPPRVEHELREEEIEALLAHELAHAERRDAAWLVVCRAIEVVFFFQPLNRLCATWMADEAEYLADDCAVARTGERVGLASCLTEIAGWMVHEERSQLVAGMAARGTRLALRVGRLLDETHEPEKAARGTRVAHAFAPLGLAAALCVPGVTTGRSGGGDTLAEKTTRLELALSELPGVASTPEEVQACGESLDDVLARLRREIELLREEAFAREAPEALLEALESIADRASDLESRAADLQSRLTSTLQAAWSASFPVVFVEHPSDFVIVSKD